MRVTRIRITSRRPGFRRAGLAHPAGPVEYPIDRFTPEQLEQLRAEPTLIVEPIDEAAEAEAAAAAARPRVCRTCGADPDAEPAATETHEPGAASRPATAPEAGGEPGTGDQGTGGAAEGGGQTSAPGGAKGPEGAAEKPSGRRR